MKPKGILFFADRLPPLIGGVEMHARYFIEYFTNNLSFPLLKIVSKQYNDYSDLKEFNPSVIFFNSGRWIEDLSNIKKLFQKALFMYRTGGNEILKAPLVKVKIADHRLRQQYWVDNLNATIDILITNSAYTEQRLREFGVMCKFVRCVGGVNTKALQQAKIRQNEKATIFCAARFVPYKNHKLLISVFNKLVSNGHDLRLRLAGDGELLDEIKTGVAENNLSTKVEFLGALSNEESCREIANADIYMQLSKDRITSVPGGSYTHSEGMGRSILEALSAGTFIVAGKSGALSEIITEDKGILVEFNDTNKIVASVTKILDKLPIKLPQTDEFDWSKIFAKYENFMKI